MKELRLTIWENFTRIPKKAFNEELKCVMKGKEQFKLVSPIFRQNIYVGVWDKYSEHFSPLNFFDVDLKRYPHAKEATFINVTLSAGDCLYIPAYYYY